MRYAPGVKNSDHGDERNAQGSPQIPSHHPVNPSQRWAQVLILVGQIAMLVGAIDPLEGSLAILPGSALVALGTFLGQTERPWLAQRLWAFGLIACGVAVMFGISTVGGLGGRSGHSMWWGLLILPYPIGWLLGLWGNGSPRWVKFAGIAVGVWYLVIPALVLLGPGHRSRPIFPAVLATVVAFGLVIIGGCLWRLRRHPALA